MTPPFSTPQEAVLGLIKAYQSLEIDKIVESKDFDIDSKLFWEGLGLPVSKEKLAESRLSFEKNFRKQMEEELPDYRDVEFSFISENKLQENLVVLTVSGKTPEEEFFELQLPVFYTDKGWKVVLHFSYDQL